MKSKFKKDTNILKINIDISTHILTCLKYPKIKWSLPHLENESVDVNFCDI